MHDCKTCQHSRILYQREREDKYNNAYFPVGWVLCAGPRHKSGRSYPCKDSRKACADYKPKERGGAV